MGVYEIHVGVALRRPPRTDEIRKYLIDAETPLRAELLACQWAACTSVMPVFSVLVVCDPECPVDPDTVILRNRTDTQLTHGDQKDPSGVISLRASDLGVGDAGIEPATSSV